MKNKINYPTAFNSLPDSEKNKVVKGFEFDFNVNALIGKLKCISSLCTTDADILFVTGVLNELHELLDTRYDEFMTDFHNEAEC